MSPRRTYRFRLAGIKYTALCLASLFGLYSPSSLFAREEQTCVSMTSEPKEASWCENSSAWFWESDRLQAYSTFVENNCEQGVQIQVSTRDQGRVYLGYAAVPANGRAELIGCGKPDRPVGWCFEDEMIDHRCPEGSLKKVLE